MKIFLTGTTGLIGRAVLNELQRSGHQVTGLVRDASSAAPLAAPGVDLVEGSLESLPGMGDLLSRHDAFVHTAMAGGGRTSELDRLTIDVVLEHAPAGSFFLYTSGVWIFGNTGDAAVREDSPTRPLPISAWRAPHEARVLEAGEGVKTAVIRPGCVYGGAQSLLEDWFARSEKGSPLRVVGDGRNHWAMIHVRDLARCYVKALELRATGILHATDDTRDAMRTMAEAVARTGSHHSAVELVPLDAARRDLGEAFADALAVDQHVSSAATRERLGWHPESKTFLSSLDSQWEEWRASRSRP
ncbi:MAG: NAD-dependent epimerase/dehydratase family protein [Thermoanaerobaculia bacterium]